jgi:hypothetical protein
MHGIKRFVAINGHALKYMGRLCFSLLRSHSIIMWCQKNYYRITTEQNLS